MNGDSVSPSPIGFQSFFALWKESSPPAQQEIKLGEMVRHLIEDQV